MTSVPPSAAPPAVLADDRQALAFLLAAGADVAVDAAPRRWLSPPPAIAPRAVPPATPPAVPVRPASARPAPAPAAASVAPADHPAMACENVEALLALLGKFPDARARPPLLFEGALTSGVWVLIDRPDHDPAHRAMLDRMMQRIDLDWNRTALVSRLNWPTPGDVEPSPAQLARFAPVLDRLAMLHPPRLVLALGQTAAEVAGREARLASSRGRWFGWRSARLLPTLHPRTMADNTVLKKQAFEHLKLFRAEVG